MDAGADAQPFFTKGHHAGFTAATIAYGIGVSNKRKDMVALALELEDLERTHAGVFGECRWCSTHWAIKSVVSSWCFCTVLSVGEWRPRLAARFPRKLRIAIRALAMLAKAGERTIRVRRDITNET